MRRLILLAMVLAASNDAQAVTIIDTGESPNTGPSGGLVVGINQSLAAEFTLTQPYTLTDIEGFIGGEVAGTGTVAIYSDGGSIPGSELFSNAVSLGVG